MNWQEKFAAKRATSAEEVILQIPRGKPIFIGSGAAQPVGLVDAMGKQAQHFSDNVVVHLMTLGRAPYAAPEYQEYFRHNAFFIGANVRQAVHEGRADYTPVFLSQIPSLIRSGRIPVKVALIQCSPPDQFGFVNLGVSVDITLAAIDAADLVIAEINENVPVIHGGGFLAMDRIDYWICNKTPLICHNPMTPDAVSMEIGRNVASLIKDGNTLQLGIGQIPDATLKALTDKKDLGIWTEMFSDGVLDLMEAGVITGKYKTVHPGKVTSSFTFGSQRLYEYLHRNPKFTFHPSDYVNDPIRIARQHKMVAINSALEVDLTGQVCADSIGTRFYSGIGGQVDFIRGAAMCPGGRPIIALPSTAKGGSISRISAVLTRGAGVTTSRGDVRYVVTEYGIADLLGKNIRERAVALISIAHPDFRGELLQEAKNQHYVFFDQLEPKGTYPRSVEKTFTTKDGHSIRLRAIKATDEPKLSALFYSVNDNTLYKRFQRVIKSIPHQELQYFLDVDYEKNMAIVLEYEEEGKEPTIVAVAQYFIDPNTNFAEAAFLVRDDWQGRGLGAIMVEEMILLAKEHGIEGLTAEVLHSNRAMMSLFQKSGLQIEQEEEEDIYRLKMPFSVSKTHS